MKRPMSRIKSQVYLSTACIININNTWRLKTLIIIDHTYAMYTNYNTINGKQHAYTPPIAYLRIIFK